MLKHANSLQSIWNVVSSKNSFVLLFVEIPLVIIAAFVPTTLQNVGIQKLLRKFAFNEQNLLRFITWKLLKTRTEYVWIFPFCKISFRYYWVQGDSWMAPFQSTQLSECKKKLIIRSHFDRQAKLSCRKMRVETNFHSRWNFTNFTPTQAPA